MPKETVVCNGCGYTGGPTGDDWEGTSGFNWGRCPKCGTTNLDVKAKCGTCGAEMHNGVYGLICKKCNP